MGELKSDICLICSSGGHLAQIKQLIPIVEKYNFFFVTEKNISTKDLCIKYKTYYLRQQERKNIFFIFNLIYNTIKSLIILLRERPKIIISTGAGVVIPMCVFGHFLGSRIVFIESFAKINTPTITGRIVYKICDKFYIQWHDLKKYYPKAEYRGTIY